MHLFLKDLLLVFQIMFFFLAFIFLLEMIADKAYEK